LGQCPIPMDPQLHEAPSSEQVAAFFRKHRTGLVALVFTDLVDSTALLNQLGDQAGASFLRQRREIIRDTLRALPEAEEIETAGDSFLLVFSKPSDAVRFALLTQARLRAFSAESRLSVQERMGIHLGEVVISEHETEVKAKDLYGLQLATCARVMSLAQGAQILLTRGVFDSARQVLKGEDIPGVGRLSWVSHGPYLLKGIEEAVEVCEVGEAGQSPLAAPKTSEKAQRQVRPDEEPVLGWRPAVGQEVPNTKWVLEEKLGEGGFGEVWVGRHQTLKEQHVFKFCFRADRVRSLKREVTLFRLLKERVGEHPGIVRLHNVYFDQPPFYLEEEYVSGKDLRSWCEAQGGVEQVPQETRLEIIAQAAEALQAAHDSGIIHRDVKPGNILVSGDLSGSKPLVVKLTDFGIGQVISAEYLAGVTKAGFTQTMLGSTSSGTGTTMYLAPEIIAGMPATTRSDIYSLGVVLYQLLVGDFKRPLTTDWVQEIQEQLLREDLQRCLAGKPEERFTGVGQLARHLRALPERRAELALREAEKAALERAAYRRGVIRAVGFSAALVLAFLVLSLLAFTQSRRARRETKESAHRLYASEMNLAQQALVEGNVGRVKELLNRHRPDVESWDFRGWEWRHLYDRCRSDELFSLRGHSNRVTVVRFFPDGEHLASASGDGTVRLWDLASHQQIAVLRHQERVYGMDVSRDGRWIASASWDKVVKLWDVSSRQPVCTLTNAFTFHSLAFSPDSRLLAGDGRGGMALWRVPSGEVVTNVNHTTPFLMPHGLSFSPDGRYLAYASESSDVRLLDVGSLKNAGRLSGQHEMQVLGLAFSPDGRRLASCDSERFLCLWDLSTQRPVWRLTNSGLLLISVTFSPDGQTLVTASGDRSVRFRRPDTGEQVGELRGHADEVWSVAYSQDGHFLATGGKDDLVRVWDAKPKVRRPLVREWPKDASEAFASADGDWLLVIRSNQTYSISPIFAQQELDLLEWPSPVTRRGPPDMGTHHCAGIALAPGAKTFACWNPGTVMLWDSVRRKQIAKLPTGSGPTPAVKFSGDGRMLVVATPGSKVHLFNLTDSNRVEELPLSSGGLLALAVSHDGRVVATGYQERLAEIWDAGRRREVIKVVGHKDRVVAVAVSTDGSRFASASEDASVRVWDVRARREIGVLTGQLLAFYHVAFSPDGTRLAGAGADGTVKLWDLTLTPPQELATFISQNRPLYWVGFSSDGNTLYAAGRRLVERWEAQPMSEIDAAEKAQAGAITVAASAK